MSLRERRESGDHAQPPRNYEVGYGKPPAGRRFAKGVSGNPAGRPRKQLPQIRLGGQVTATDELWLEEAATPVPVRQNGELRKVPARKAVMLRLRNEALSGKISAIRAYIVAVESSERALGTQALEEFKTLMELKVHREEELKLRRARGLLTDDVLPHPDDILIDARSGWARVVGPVTRAERQDCQVDVRMRDRFQEMVSELARSYELSTASELPGIVDDWHRAQEFYDMINDRIPPSLRRDLADRSRASGASQAGQFFDGTPEAYQRLLMGDNRTSRRPAKR